MDQENLVDPEPATDRASLQEAGLQTTLMSVPMRVCVLITALNKAGFRQSPAEVASVTLRDFHECRRKHGNSMVDFLFRFDLARTTAHKIWNRDRR